MAHAGLSLTLHQATPLNGMRAKLSHIAQRQPRQFPPGQINIPNKRSHRPRAQGLAAPPHGGLQLPACSAPAPLQSTPGAAPPAGPHALQRPGTAPGGARVTSMLRSDWTKQLPVKCPNGWHRERRPPARGAVPLDWLLGDDPPLLNTCRSVTGRHRSSC